MAVASVILSSAGASGSAEGKSGSVTTFSYTSRYRVHCDNQNDTAPIVLAFFATNAAYPWMGRIFSFGNGFDGSVLCNKVTADAIDKSAGWFDVTCEFTTLQGDEDKPQGKDITGKNTNDPTQWHDEISVSYTNINEPAEKGTYRGQVNGKGNAFLKPGQERAITNSANIAFDPPLQRENSIEVIRITKYYKESQADTFGPYRNKVNSDEVTIYKPDYGFTRTASNYKLKFTDYSEDFAFENNIKYWRGTVEVQIHPRDWRRQPVDRGLNRRMTEGDKDDAGNTISASDITTNFVHHTPVINKDGLPVTEPVLLDGNGQPLDPKRDPVYLVYSVEDEVPLQGIIGAL